jgi:hypothetical protein
LGPKRSPIYPKHKFGAAERLQIGILLSLASFGPQINQAFMQPLSFSILFVFRRSPLPCVLAYLALGLIQASPFLESFVLGMKLEYCASQISR